MYISIALTVLNLLLTGTSGYYLFRTRKLEAAQNLLTQISVEKIDQKLLQTQDEVAKATIQAMLSTTEASLAKQFSTVAEGCALRAELNALNACSHKEAARDFANRASEHRKIAELHASTAGEHVSTAQEHVTAAAEHVKTAGTLSVAVTEAATRAAAKSQKQAECSACHRAVNSYVLRGDGRVVCKWCSDRRKG